MNFTPCDSEDRSPINSARLRVSEMVSAGASITDILTEIVHFVEGQCCGMLCSILIIDSQSRHFRVGAAPSLPAAYNALFQDVMVGEGVGSCGTAAHRKELVVVHDIARDPLWENYKEFALPHGLKACWSIPLLFENEVVGTFASYYRESRSPNSEEMGIVSAAAKLATAALYQRVLNSIACEQDDLGGR